MSDSFENAGYGQGEVGWGTKPAIIAVPIPLKIAAEIAITIEV